MDINSLSKKLLFNTVRVDTVMEDGSEGSGTAFVVSHAHRRGTHTFIVTNRHLVDGVREGGLVFTQKHNGQPVLGQRFQLNIEDFPHAWFTHPNPDIDLAIVPMRPLEQAARDQGVELYYHVIDSRLAPDAATLRGLDALEEVLFIGYPSGVWDHVNLMPIMRRGTTATPMALNFEGRAEFLIDAAVYPGSSGSPVFVYQPDVLRPNQSRKFLFAGVIAAVFFREEANQLVPGPVPPQQNGVVMGSEMIDLGLVIKSAAVIEVIEAYLTKWLE
ncbi:Trypsin-like peptidase domain-containing protein [Ectothiorhodosinus mongolicus]|uniref:Trypsin-like peptidase domain-containing protein n=1 Tax=Ectothiorhodosinus mongolicus TaxID=233100 RepID=A0A1R3VX29_9GAMM|nr:serine protease [Ectothiorhodosinus mongolicus]ULX57037.1 serine protease [Ectothiorhodosinus mongolicus]SIT69579.1 Trypsin-like peptidase domain-containing protein [Ectothiorhodosinus mongolicus]